MIASTSMLNPNERVEFPLCSNVDEPTTSQNPRLTSSQTETFVSRRRLTRDQSDSPSTSNHFTQNSRLTSSQRQNIMFNDFSLYLLFALAMLIILPSGVQSRSVAVSAKCYFFGPGTTIHGADYRRDYGLSRKECAEQCKSDVCCMAFEFLDGRCTLKSRSLNGSITTEADAYFGLCLDFDDSDRDNFWDHELGGSVVSTKEKIDRESCVKFCGYQENAIIYSWNALDEKDPDGDGDCNCVGVLHSIKLSFGSASGFLV